jgi:hypothetical protein
MFNVHDKMRVISKQSDLFLYEYAIVLFLHSNMLRLLLVAGFEERFQKESLLCSSDV